MIKKVAETPANCTLLISNFISVDHRGRSTVKMKRGLWIQMCATFRPHYPNYTRRVEQNIFLSMQYHRLISYHSDCCRSQALNLSIRPVYLGGKASPAPAPKPPPKKPVKTYHKKKPVHKKPASKIGIVCIPACQTLCKPVCEWVVYLLYAWI